MSEPTFDYYPSGEDVLDVLEELTQADRTFNGSGVQQPAPQPRVTLPPHLMEQVEAWMKEEQSKVEPVD